MKNIHVLPTDKPSRLSKDENDRIWLSINFEYGINDNNKQNIYITSDEEIKEGDWGYSKSRNKICKVTGISKWTHKDDYSIDLDNENYFIHHSYCKKIILTTDQDLIKDGVQAIDDDFLEWFVKNPSCEEVEVAKTNKLIDNYADKDEDKWEVKYHIYFPKEEPKQETLEEAAGSCAIKENRSSLYELGMKYFMDGAKWQQEKMYSEEEVVKLLIKFNQEIQEVENVREWFEEFKKK